MTVNINPITQNQLGLKLKPVFIGKLTVVESLDHPAFYYHEGRFQSILDAHDSITNSFLSDYAQKYSREIFIHQHDFNEINQKLKDELTKITRSISSGDVKRKTTRHTNLLTMQMDNLYSDPFNDEILSNQFQNSKNLSSILLGNKKIQKDIYDSVLNSNYHYTYVQPLSSSILLLSFLQSLKLFNEKETQGLFLTSYFKDIGMSFIPREKFELAHLDEFDQNLFAKHSQNSMEILKGRVPLNQSQLNLIKNHHFLNYKMQSLVNQTPVLADDEFISGIESTLVSAMDILVAMTSPRPYREPASFFTALELLKKIISDDYPQEYKALVIFLKKFLSK